MTLHDLIVIIAAGVNLIALGGFAYWIGGLIRALKGTVDAQGKTIAAQKEFIQGLQTLLDATDTPKMLERLKAYKELLELEQEALRLKLERQFSEEKEKISQLSERQERHLGRVVEFSQYLASGFIGLVGELMRYPPLAERKKVIAASKFDEDMKVVLYRMADLAPEMTLRITPATGSLTFTGYVPRLPDNP